MAHSKVVESDQAASHGQHIAEQLKAEVFALQSDLVELSEGCDQERHAHQQVHNIINTHYAQCEKMLWTQCFFLRDRN